MAKFLIKRGNVWWFVRGVPVRLRPIVGLTAWAKPLKVEVPGESEPASVYTRDVANRVQPKYAAWCYAEEAKAEALLKAGWKPPVPALVGGTFSREELEAMEYASEQSALEEDAALAPERFFTERYAAEIADIEADMGKPLFALTPEKAAAVLVAQRAVEAERLADMNEAARHFVQSGEAERLLRTKPEPVQKPAAARTVNGLLAAYEKAKLAGWSAATVAAFAPVRRLLSGVLGTREVKSLTREDARKVQGLVVRLPKNLGRQKALAGLPIERAIEKAATLGLPVVSAKTVNDGYIVHITAVFAWAVVEEWASSNPFQRLTVHDPVADRDRRDPFTVAQLQTLFASGPWDAADDSRPGRYWGPLLALFQGGRLSEVTGLEVQDVAEVDGVWAIHIRPNSLRDLKNEGSRRTVPVHPSLLERGFAAYVEGRKAVAKAAGTPAAPLFPDVRAKARGQFGYNIGVWFGDQIKALGLEGRLLGMHSLRHSFEDELRRIGLHGTPLGLALAGREEGGSAAGYGSGYTMAQVLGALEQVTYPGLKLPGA